MDRALTAHGGLDPAELRSLGLRPEQVLDFSSNINPLGSSARVRRAAAEADLSAYPDRQSLELREALSARLGVGIDCLAVGNGSTELIHLLVRARLQPGDRCLVFAPTFGEYEAAAAIAGAEVHFLRAEAADGFRWSFDEAEQAIGELDPSLVFLCNPNNPTGVYLDKECVRRVLATMGGGSLLLLDDAYVPFVGKAWDSLSLLGDGSLAILRSMTKDHALAGVRLGYMAAEQSVISAVRRLQPAWSVNAVAHSAGIAALKDERHVAAAKGTILEVKDYIYRKLDALGVVAFPSAANFVLAWVGDGAKVRSELLRRRIAVRDCASFGLPEYIRFAVRRPDECTRLIGSLKEVLGDD